MKILLGISIVFIILLTQTSSVAAVTDQGLEWGIEVGDRFDYNVEVEFHNTTMDLIIDDEMYVIINELPTIADHITSGAQLPMLHLAINSYTTYWDNGTVMDSLWLDILNIGIPFMCYPIGNYSLLTELFEASPATTIITQNTTIMNYTVVDQPYSGNVHTMVFQKSNGAPVSTLFNGTWNSVASVHVDLALIQSTTITTTTASGTTGTTTGIGDSNLILILGGATAVVIVVFAIVIIRRK
jgi:hypothetical protein